eukprot:1525297-Rhodomonas_salina.1
MWYRTWYSSSWYRSSAFDTPPSAIVVLEEAERRTRYVRTGQGVAGTGGEDNRPVPVSLCGGREGREERREPGVRGAEGQGGMWDEGARERESEGG